MSDIMRPVPFDELIIRISEEESLHNSIFSIGEKLFSNPKKGSVKIFGREIKGALGPAAGPHTQLAQNIIASFLVGSRFIELKTVQIMDTLEIEKPCIDAFDEGYNVEWSTEYTLEKAYDEYIKAYVICHMLDARNGNDEPSFMFNMSVGYNLEGIKKERMQAYIDSMIDASKRENLKRYIDLAKELISDGYLIKGDEKNKKLILKRLDRISFNVSPIVTVSTMHGCPPEEIEAICKYLMDEKSLDLFVKLNPTLLGYEEVRRTLDDLGFGYVELSREAFSHDLQYPDAIEMLTRLRAFAKEKNRHFGVKLTNTLGNINPKDRLPGDERYMSGRALLPISTKLALKLSKEFDGDLSISYSGGASELTAKDILEAGIAPVTLATDILKPGGYTRLSTISRICDIPVDNSSVKIEMLERIVKRANDPSGSFSKDYRGTYSAKVNTPLDLFDCYVSPCVEACPIHQDIPEYIELAAEGRREDALELIYAKNALPNITGWICDHQCQNHCTRLDYEGPVKIREVKRLLSESEGRAYLERIKEELEPSSDIKAAVIGGGPAGLSAAYFLSLSGFDVHLFEKERDFGGVVMSTIPSFRIPREAVDRDVDLIKALGVKMHLGTEKTISELKKEKFRYIFVAIGATCSNDPGVKGNGLRESAISFLSSSKKNKRENIGLFPVIVGGGNTAMDAARMAVRTEGVKKVRVVYRRTENEMPADLEEYRAALGDGIEFMFLHNPVELVDGRLTLMKMVLSDVDSSGRRSPKESGETETIDCTALITAIGEKVDMTELDRIGYRDEDGVYLIGDAATGPSTIVRCIESAKEAVDSALDDFFEGSEIDDDAECSCEGGEDHHHHHHDEDEEEDDDEDISEASLRALESEYFEEISKRKSRILFSDEKDGLDEFFKREGQRCLECTYLCNKCVDVCPNRANVAIDTREGEYDFEDPFQVIHLDAYCNECGNCKTFCPHLGAPYLDKFTLFSRLDDFESSKNSGFYLEDEKLYLRLDGTIFEIEIDEEGNLSQEIPEEVESLLNTIFKDYGYLLGRVEE